MFTSVLFRRIFLAILLSVAFLSVVVYLACVPMIQSAMYRVGENAARAMLESVDDLLQTKHRHLEAFREYALDVRKRQIKNATLVQESFLKTKYREFQQGFFLSEEQAKQVALDELRTFRYGEGNYFWVATYDGVFISHPDPRLQGRDFSSETDVYGNPILAPMIQVARERNEGYTAYWWPRLGEEEPVRKVSYSRNFPIWDWVIGSGFYEDEVEREVAARKSAIVSDLRRVLGEMRIADRGYLFIFDSGNHMLVHPNPNIEGTDFSQQLNPDSGRPIGPELKAVSENPTPRLAYRWDRPDDPGNYTHDKIAWVRYSPEFDWYVVASVYTEDLNRPALALRKQLLLIALVTFLVSLAVATLLLGNILTPIRNLAGQAAEFLRKGDTVLNRYHVDTGEIGVLGAAFYAMVEKIDGFKRELKEKERRLRSSELIQGRARERAFEAERENVRLKDRLEAYQREFDSLRRSEDRYRAMLENIEEYFYEIDLLGNLIFFNDALFKMLGYTRDEMVGMNFREYMDPETSEKAEQLFRRAFETGQTQRGDDWRLLSRDGKVRQVEISVSLIKDGDGETVGYRGVARDVSDLIYLVYHDTLTGLLNRKAFFKRLKETLAYARRDQMEKNIFYLDMDKFKKVNDEYGHDVGDEVLIEVGRRLRDSLRETDHVCRLGGDEFTVILNNAHNSYPEQVAERVVENLSRPYHVKAHEIDFLSPSVGISGFPKDAETVEELIRCADIAMFEAKKTGGRFAFYSPDLNPLKSEAN
jgi:diguanylate cyclase (GGDEF)-like protein/PAS domain S-box-containing protein